MRPDWQRLQKHPNADIDFYLTIGEARQSVLRPHVVYVSRDKTIVCMAVGRIEKPGIAIRVGYKDIWRPKVRSLTVVQGGILGDCSGAVAELLMAELLKVIRNGEADMLSLHAIPTDCDLLEIARKSPRFQAAAPSPHWSMRVPGNPRDIFKRMKAKHRSFMRRLPQVLEEDFPGYIVFRHFSSEEQIGELCADAEKIARHTYQRGLGVGFADNGENRRRLGLAASKGWLYGYVLYIDGDPCAFWIGTKYKRTLYLDFTGYHSKCREYRPGTVLLIKMLETLTPEDVETIDFGLGDAFYKSRFGDRQWLETWPCIYASTWKGRALYFSIRTASGFSQLLRAILDRAKLTDKVKKLWRKRLATTDRARAAQSAKQADPAEDTAPECRVGK